MIRRVWFLSKFHILTYARNQALFNQRLSKYKVMRNMFQPGMTDKQSSQRYQFCGNRLGREGSFCWCPHYGRVVWAWHQRSHRQRSSSLHNKSAGNWAFSVWVSQQYLQMRCRWSLQNVRCPVKEVLPVCSLDNTGRDPLMSIWTA